MQAGDAYCRQNGISLYWQHNEASAFTANTPMRTKPLILIFTAFLSGFAQAAPPKPHPVKQPASPQLSADELNRFIQDVSRQFNVPGIAVAVIKDQRIVYESGFGLRNLESKRPVDRHTKFCIASITKSVTATALEMLADRGRLKMTDRVIDHLPWFRMSDPYVTRELRVRDLLAHRSGLGPHAGDLLFVPETTYSNREVAERLAELPLASGFRDGFSYENAMFAVASLVVEQASAENYADFVRNQIFAPLRMSDAVINASHFGIADNYATAYQPGNDALLDAIPAMAWENNPGAAGIYASIDDMAKWTKMQLGAAPHLLSEAAQRRMWSMLVPIEIDPPPTPELTAAQPNFLGYGEGWYLSDYRGHRTVWHGGEFPGTVSLLTLLPESHLGIVVLTNQETDNPLYAITLYIIDEYLQDPKMDPKTDWLKAYLEAERQAHQLHSVANGQSQQAGGSLPVMQSMDLKAFAGLYRDRWYGDVAVDFEHDGLRILFTHSPRLIGTMAPVGDRKFLVTWDDRTLKADAFIEFDADKSGTPVSARMSRAYPDVSKAYDYQDLQLQRVGDSAGSSP
jgi:CubicO group peptidase (beta-lactamase class C family)